MKLKEILKKLVTGGYFSGSADTDIAITKAISQIRKELEIEISKIEERFPLSLTGDYDLGAQEVIKWIKRIVKSFYAEE